MKAPGVLLALLLATPCAAPAADGAALFERWCEACHGDDASAPGRLKLAWTRGVDRASLAGRRDLDAAYVRQVVRRGQAEMPGFRKTEISDAELDALAGWLGRSR